MTEDQYLKLKEAHWDGKAMLYSEALDQFYNSPDDAIEDIEERGEGQTIEDLEDLMLRICEPVYARPLEIDNWTADLGEDGVCGVPGWLEEAIDAFNKSIADKPPLSWTPGKTRLVIEKEESE